MEHYHHYPFIFPSAFSQFYPDMQCSVRRGNNSFSYELANSTLVVLFLLCLNGFSQLAHILLTLQKIPNCFPYAYICKSLMCLQFLQKREFYPNPRLNCDSITHCPVNAQQYFANEFHFYSNYLRATLGRQLNDRQQTPF